MPGFVRALKSAYWVLVTLVLMQLWPCHLPPTGLGKLDPCSCPGWLDVRPRFASPGLMKIAFFENAFFENAFFEDAFFENAFLRSERCEGIS